jgi:sulfite exporter TauE/SafE
MNAKLNGASYIVLFIIGMLKSIHCVGMCGGIMISQSISKKDESKTEATNKTVSNIVSGIEINKSEISNKVKF